VQRIGAAGSDDLVRRRRRGPRFAADPRRYETRAAGAPEEHWRDPWVLWDAGSACFLGELSDPMAVTVRADGSLAVDVPAPGGEPRR
jgi:hypothetical protein